MYLGTFSQKLDDKGRVFVPAKYREQFGKGIVVARRQDRCLAIWEPEVFAKELERASTGSSTNQRVRDYQRMVASGASDELPDNQGRITIPPPLRTYAGLVKDIVVIGADNHLEVWDATRWAEYSAALEDAFAAMDEEGF